MSRDDVRKSVDDLVGDALPDYNETLNNRTISATNNHVVQVNNLNITSISKKVQYTRIILNPGIEHITDRQAAELKRLVDKIATREGQPRPFPMTFGKIWKLFNRRMGITSYKLLPKECFGEAREFLKSWAGLLSFLAESPQEEKDWYVRRYSILFSHIGKLGLRNRFHKMIATEFGAESAEDLSARDLMSVYRTVSKWFHDILQEI